MGLREILSKSGYKKKIKELLESLDGEKGESLRERGKEAFEVLYEEFLAHPDTKRYLRKRRAGRKGSRKRHHKRRRSEVKTLKLLD